MLFALQMSPGIIANPFAAGIGRKNSLESISSIDRDLSPEELEILQKVGAVPGLGASLWKSPVSPLVHAACSVLWMDMAGDQQDPPLGSGTH